MAKLHTDESNDAAARIDARIAELGDWRGTVLARVRVIIRRADPSIVEEWKWRVPVWSHGGIVCTGEAYKQAVKLTFARGAKLKDPAGLFNASLDGNARRAIDIREGETIDPAALAALVREAVALNGSLAKRPARPGGKAMAKGTSKRSAKAAATPEATGGPSAVKLLSGGNPQIAKGDGDGPVQAYIAAMPGWKGDIGRRLDALISRTVPDVRKAVRWNTPFYGVEGRGWFLGFHCFAKYVKVTFLKGASLTPLPPGESKHQDVRYLDIREDGTFDDKQFAGWIRQASELPGDPLF